MSDSNNGVLGEILEQGASVVKQTASQIKNIPVDLTKTAKGQVVNQNLDQNPAGINQPSEDKKVTEEFVKKLYSPTEKPAEKVQNPQKAPELTEEQKITKLRQELHSKYYQNLVNRPKPKEEPVAEKLEREKKQEMVDLQEKEREKPAPLVVERAQNIEKHRGSSG